MIKANFDAYNSYVTDSIYQWDINRTLSVSGLNLSVAPEVHFSNASMDKAIVRQASLKDHIVTVAIPNSLLQAPLGIDAHIGIYEGNAFKAIEHVRIPVMPRNRPSDYRIENSDEEIYSFEALKNALANKADAATINARVDNIIAHNNDTEGNTELIDIRNGVDGEVYPTAGSAVREQVAKVANGVDALTEIGGIKWFEDCYITLSGVMYTDNPGRRCTDFIPCGVGVEVTFIAETAHTGVSGLTFYDGDKNVVGVNVNIGENSKEYTVTSPENTRYLRLSTGDAIGWKLIFSTPAIFAALADTAKRAEEIAVTAEHRAIYDCVINGKSLEPFSTNEFKVSRSSGIDDLTISSGGYYFATVKYSTFEGIAYIGVKHDGGNHIDISFSANGTTSVSEDLAPYITTETVNGMEVAKIEKGYDEYPYAIVRIDNRSGVGTLTVSDLRIVDGGEAVKSKTCYVSTFGDDGNDGTIDNPLATVNQALENGASVVYMRNGIYEQTIDLGKAQSNHIKIASYDATGRVIFLAPNRLIAETETLVDGYTKVYSAVISNTFADDNIWIFQDGVNDMSTLISDAERHSLERGYEYRCHDTKIALCEATNLGDALTEIEAADEYKWYFDDDTYTVYFSRPQAVTVDNPLCGSFKSYLFGNANREITLELYGLESKYMMFDISNTVGSVVTDCKATNVFGGGAFLYNKCLGAKFIRCEAARCYSGSNGDGFNAHSELTGDAYAKQTTVSLIDCWSHDNNDDGYSDHERSETTIIGGLYEYNGKAGVTPSYGSHCSCYNVYSRNNYAGFYYTGEAALMEGGKHGQMICYNCVAENNTRGGVKDGFRVDGAGNSMILVNCKSIGNERGYVIANDECKAKLIDCGSLNDGSVKSGSFEILNTSIIT